MLPQFPLNCLVSYSFPPNVHPPIDLKKKEPSHNQGHNKSDKINPPRQQTIGVLTMHLSESLFPSEPDLIS